MAPHATFKPILLAAMMATSGCAMTTAVPVTEDNPNPNGFLVNATSTIFVQDAAGIRPLTYSDPCKRYAVKFWAIAAKNNSTLTLSEPGTLASIAADLDSTDVPLKILELGGKLIDKIPDGFQAANNQAAGTDSRVRFFDIQCGENGQSFLVERRTVGPIGYAGATSNVGKPINGNNKPDLVN